MADPSSTNRLPCWLLAILAAGWIATASPVSADIYMYVDKNGVMHFTNAPASSRYRLFMREPRALTPSRDTRRYDALISEAARTHGMNPALIKAVIKAESDFDPRAVSKRGAMGLMQIMPQNFEPLRISDPFNPRQNIMGGTRYLKEMFQRFGKDLQLALAAYNAGPNAVEQYRSIPPFPETRQYIRKVMRYYTVFRKG